MKSTLKDRPKKPYPSFPLTPNPNGQWCKEIRGKVHFFGVWAQPDQALERYHTLAGDLHAGRPAPLAKVSGDGLTVKEVCNAFLHWQKEKSDTGEIGVLWFEDCRRMVSAFAQAVCKNRLVSDLRPEDFQRYRPNTTALFWLKIWGVSSRWVF